MIKLVGGHNGIYYYSGYSKILAGISWYDGATKWFKHTRAGGPDHIIHTNQFKNSNDQVKWDAIAKTMNKLYWERSWNMWVIE